jgi:hypothetical protein
VPAEPYSAVIDDTGFLKGEEVFVAAVGWDEALDRLAFLRGNEGTEMT